MRERGATAPGRGKKTMRMFEAKFDGTDEGKILDDVFLAVREGKPCAVKRGCT